MPRLTDNQVRLMAIESFCEAILDEENIPFYLHLTNGAYLKLEVVSKHFNKRTIRYMSYLGTPNPETHMTLNYMNHALEAKNLKALIERTVDFIKLLNTVSNKIIEISKIHWVPVYQPLLPREDEELDHLPIIWRGFIGDRRGYTFLVGFNRDYETNKIYHTLSTYREIGKFETEDLARESANMILDAFVTVKESIFSKLPYKQGWIFKTELFTIRIKEHTKGYSVYINKECVENGFVSFSQAEKFCKQKLLLLLDNYNQYGHSLNYHLEI